MKLVSFDLETNGEYREYALQPYRMLTDKAWITSFAYSTKPGVAEGCLFPRVGQLRKFLNTCAKHKARIVCWNASFDIAWLIASGLREEVYACQWLDAMLLYRHLTITPLYLEPFSYGLKAAVAKFYPEASGYGDDIDFAATDPKSLASLQAYNRLDAMYTLLLANKFLNVMPPPMKRNALIEAACLPQVAESTITGLAVNQFAATKLSQRLQDDRNLAFVKLKLTGVEVTPEILASPLKLAQLLYYTWGLPCHKLTEKGAQSTDKEALQMLALQDERAQWVRDYREAMNNKTKFVDAVLASVAYNADGRTRPQARVYGTYSGRMTYYSTQGKGVNELQTGFALHQMKRGTAFRDLIQAPEGYDLLEFDFSGQEFRWMAVESNDPDMLKLCLPGEDAHAYMGAQIKQIAYHKLREQLASPDDTEAVQTRFLGKLANLSLQYRNSPETFQRVAAIQYQVKLSNHESANIVWTYKDTYRQVPQYWKRAIYHARKNGYAETRAGRRVQLLTGEHWAPELRWSLESTAINFPIQGVGADQKYLALLVLRNMLPTYNAKFYFELHDGLFVIAPTAKAEQAAHAIRQALSNLPYTKAWDVILPISFPVDAKIGKTWGTLEKLDG